MSLNKLFLAFVIFTSMGCVDVFHHGKEYYIVGFKTAPGEVQMQKLNEIIAKNSHDRVGEVIVVYNNNNYQEAKKLKESLFLKYEVNSTLRFLQNKNVHVTVLVENKNQAGGACYQFAVDDYDWYKATYQEMKEYEDAIICPITVNDNEIRM